MPRHPRGAADPEPGDQHRLSDAEVLHQRIRVAMDLLSLAIEDIGTVPEAVRPYLILGLEAMIEAKARLEGTR